MTQSDSDLVANYLAGHSESFEILVERYLDHVYNFIYRLASQTDEANDITQEVWLRVWKNLAKFDQTKNFKTWLFAIARNATIDWLRQKRHLNFSQLDTEEKVFSDTIYDTAPLPDELYEQAEIKEKLEAIVDSLPPNYKEVVLLHVWENLTFEEIAALTGKPMNTIKSLYRRAHQKFIAPRIQGYDQDN